MTAARILCRLLRRDDKNSLAWCDARDVRNYPPCRDAVHVERCAETVTHLVGKRQHEAGVNRCVTGIFVLRRECAPLYTHSAKAFRSVSGRLWSGRRGKSPGFRSVSCRHDHMPVGHMSPTMSVLLAYRWEQDCEEAYSRIRAQCRDRLFVGCEAG